MTTLLDQATGSECSARKRAVSHHIHPHPVDYYCILALSPFQVTQTVQLPFNIQSQHLECVDSTKGGNKWRMPLLRKKLSQNPTILRAVPEAPEPGLLPGQRDMPTNDDTQRPSSNHSTVSLPDSDATKEKMSSRDTSTTSTQLRSVSELKSVLSNTSLKGAIGTYKNGKIQWRIKERSVSESDLKNRQSAERRNSRPKIQVIIPGETRDRPLPVLPFFGNTSKIQLQTSSLEGDNAHDISPPSASHGSNGAIMRDSMVSPLIQLHPTPIPFGQFQRTVSQNVSKKASQTVKHYKKSSESNHSSSDSHESDASSTHSNNSSQTSAEIEIQANTTTQLKSRFSVHSSVSAGNQAAPVIPTVKAATYRAPPSSTPPREYSHNQQEPKFRPSCQAEPKRNMSGSLVRKPTLTRKSSKRKVRQRTLTSNSNMGVIDEAITRSTSRQFSNPPRIASPTLSEAENDLQEQLTSFTEERAVSDDGEQPRTSLTDSPFKWDEVVVPKAKESVVDKETQEDPRKDSFTMDEVATSAPAVPRKSSKRQSTAFRLSQVPSGHIVSQMTRGRSRKRSQRLTITIPEYKRVTEEFVLSPIPIPTQPAKREITPGSAEAVILNILRSLDHLEDLFATAVLNRGFYRVFKRYELELFKSTLRKMSPPAWEFREIAFPGHDLLHAEDLEMTRPEEEYTPSTYLQLQKKDVHIIRAIKLQIQEKCQSFVRPEIALAMISDNHEEAARVDNALWRIWTFCKIFGSGKGREEDIVAQMDWLRGGLLVHQQTCTFSIMSTDYMNDTLVGAPECFAMGNEGGLSAEELFDMMELWNCLGVLLQGFEGRTVQARKAGIYDNTDIRGGDIDGEETMLDEWCYHLLTFGLSTVLELAGPSRQPDCYPFQIAQKNGWVSWKPPVFGGTRRNFLKEAASRVYEDKIAHTYAATSTRDVQRQQSKIRIQKHISELRHRKQNGGRMPMIRMSQERPMSDWDTVIGNLTRPRPTPAPRNDIVSYIPGLRSALAQELTTSIAELPAARTPPPPSTQSRSSSPPRRVIAQPLLPTPPPSTVPSNRDRSSVAMSMPSIEEHPAYRKTDSSIPAVPSLASHPAFRNLPLNVNPALNPAPLFTPLPLHTRNRSDSSVRSETSSSDSTTNGGRNPAFAQHETQRHIYGTELYENTADKAIYRIVEMGFTADQAREALRMTDLGDGLRVDRAVELLLSRQM